MSTTADRMRITCKACVAHKLAAVALPHDLGQCSLEGRVAENARAATAAAGDAEACEGAAMGREELAATVPRLLRGGNRGHGEGEEERG